VALGGRRLVSAKLRRKDGSGTAPELRRDGGEWLLVDGGETRRLRVLEQDGARIVFSLDGNVYRAHATVSAREVHVVVDGRASVFVRQDKTAPGRGGHGGELHEPVLRAPVPGRVLQVNATAGADVRAGDVLVVIEAMKMESPVVAPADGRVEEVHTAPGELVEQDQPLVTCAY